MKITGMLLAGALLLTGCGGEGSSSSGDDSSSSIDSGPEPDRGDAIGAQVICENFVEDRLRSPSSADFSGTEARHVRGPVWIVAGQVDSDNAFGASIRNTYICKVSYLGNDRWRLVNMQGLTS